MAFPDESDEEIGRNEWTMFVAVYKDRSKTEKYIESVTYHLPEVNPVGLKSNENAALRLIRVHQAPFLLTGKSTASFRITLEIEFKAWTGT